MSQSQDSQCQPEDHPNSNMETESESQGEEPEQKTTAGPGRKPYERHTRQQKKKLEEYFAVDQHPDDKERKVISKEVGLSPIRVKFWFQNKRTQTKNKSMRAINSQLQSELETMRKEYETLKGGLRSVTCTKCGGPATQGSTAVDGETEVAALRTKLAQATSENGQLREEVTKLRNQKYSENPWLPSPSSSAPQLSPAEAGPSNYATPSIIVAQPGPSTVGVPSFGVQQQQPVHPQPEQMGNNMFAAPGTSTMANKPATTAAATDGRSRIIGIAEAAIAELQVMAETGDPLWLESTQNNPVEFLNEEVYTRSFLKWTIPSPLGWKREATRAAVVVNMNVRDLLDILLDSKKWAAMFTGIVLRAATLEVHSTGRNYDGALQTISAEFQLPSPLIPTRETTFMRYCKKVSAYRCWVVADFAVDAIHATPTNKLLKRPSGCIINKIDSRLIKVTWVENVEVDNSFVHVMCKPFVESGAAFGARRWLAVLDRQSHRIRNVINGTMNPHITEAQRENRTRAQLNILKLAERLLNANYGGVVGSAAHGWAHELGTGVNDVRVLSRRNAEDPRMPVGVVLCATISFWMSVPPKRIFDFISDEGNRAKWDPLSENGILVEEHQIPTSNEHGNRISLHKLFGMPNIIVDKKTTFLQETSYDETCSYLVYAPVDTEAMNMCLYGGDPGKVQIMPSGITIIPDGPTWIACGSLVTASYQILVDSNPMSDLTPASIESVKGLVINVVAKIRNAVTNENPWG